MRTPKYPAGSFATLTAVSGEVRRSGIPLLIQTGSLAYLYSSELGTSGCNIGMQEQRFTIGRDRGCDIPIADESVSRLHAQLTFTEGQQIFLTDCQSSNGTFLFRG